MTEKTKIIDAMQRSDLFLPARSCSICNVDIGYKSQSSTVYLDTRCDCSSRSIPKVVPWDQFEKVLAERDFKFTDLREY